MNRLSWLELAVAMVMLATWGVLLIPAAESAFGVDRRVMCANNLRQLGRTFSMYANESRGGTYPPLSPLRDNWIVDPNAILGRYLNDFDMLRCPSQPQSNPEAFILMSDREHPGAVIGQPHPDCISSRFYVYTGFMVMDDLEAVTLFDASRSSLWETFRDYDLSRMPYNLDAYAKVVGEIPVLWDRVPNNLSSMAHSALGGNVLFRDGHVKFYPYSHDNPGHIFPMTRVSGQTFGSVFPELSSDCQPIPQEGIR